MKRNINLGLNLYDTGHYEFTTFHKITDLVPHNPLVVGSSPTGPTILKAAHCAAFVFLAFAGLCCEKS